MKLWAAELGTFWLSEAAHGLPPASAPAAPATFGEVAPGDWGALQVAMNLPDPGPIRNRFQAGRRCFCLKAAEQIVAYGWATRGVERVGELEREFQLAEDEVYIWDCATVPGWRGKRCYTVLLNQMLHRFQREGLPRIWIGASRHNQPSIQGIIRAGFRHVMDMDYRRLWVLTWVQFTASPSASPAQIEAAYRILTAKNEKRWGRVAFGLYRDGVSAFKAHTPQEAIR